MSDDFESKVTEILRSLHNQSKSDMKIQDGMRQMLGQQIEINKRLISRLDALEIEVEMLRRSSCGLP